MTNVVMQTGRIILPLVLAVLLASCQDRQGQAVSEDAKKIVVSVNGEDISLYEVKATLQNITGQKAPEHVDVEALKKVAESMVVSRVIARAAEQDIPPELMEEIEFKTAYFREQQLVKAYMNKHAPPRLVSNEMVTDYYKKHPEKFGARTIKEYELLTSGELDEKDRETVIQAFSSTVNSKDWQKSAVNLQKAGLDVQYRKGKSEAGFLDKNIRQMVGAASKATTPRPVISDKKVMMVRILAETTTDPKPLAEVSLEIRKMLQPVELRKSLEAVKEKLMQDATVEYKFENLNNTNK